jgi:phospholipid-binding lipoprotein MlaA
MGLTKHSEDFGQTLGKWGVGDRPLLLLAAHRAADNARHLRLDGRHLFRPGVAHRRHRCATAWSARAISTVRASLLPSDKVVEEAAFDRYNYIRDAYLQHRRSEIFDGAAATRAPDDDSSK